MNFQWYSEPSFYLGLKMAKMVSPYWKVDLISVAQVYSSCCSNLNEKIGHEIEIPFKSLLWITAFQLPSFEIFPMLATCTRIVFAKRNDLTLSFLTVLFNLINVWSQTSSVIFVRPVTIILGISVEEFKFWVQKIFKIFCTFSIRFLGLKRNGSQIKNPDISGAIFTLSLSILILNSQCVEGARDVRVL